MKKDNCNILYECTKCGKTFINSKNEDGLNCSNCKGPLVPLGNVKGIQKSIDTMRAKIEGAKKIESAKKQSSNLVIKVSLDTTEVERKLDRIERKLKFIKFYGI